MVPQRRPTIQQSNVRVELTYQTFSCPLETSSAQLPHEPRYPRVFAILKHSSSGLLSPPPPPPPPFSLSIYFLTVFRILNLPLFLLLEFLITQMSLAKTDFLTKIFPKRDCVMPSMLTQSGRISSSSSSSSPIKAVSSSIGDSAATFSSTLAQNAACGVNAASALGQNELAPVAGDADVSSNSSHSLGGPLAMVI